MREGCNMSQGSVAGCEMYQGRESLLSQYWYSFIAWKIIHTGSCRRLWVPGTRFLPGFCFRSGVLWHRRLWHRLHSDSWDEPGLSGRVSPPVVP